LAQRSTATVSLRLPFAAGSSRVSTLGRMTGHNPRSGLKTLKNPPI